MGVLFLFLFLVEKNKGLHQLAPSFPREGTARSRLLREAEDGVHPSVHPQGGRCLCSFLPAPNITSMKERTHAECVGHDRRNNTPFKTSLQCGQRPRGRVEANVIGRRSKSGRVEGRSGAPTPTIVMLRCRQWINCCSA